jgi:AcrR family transcriptional regulator
VAALTRQRIVETAVAMADREGFEAVTLRRIAADLGVHVTSLYNHVPTREAVTDGVVELLIEEAELPTAPVGWEEWVRRFFAAIGQLAVAHPGAFTALQRRPVQGPRASASFEVALDAFVDAGFGPADAYNAVKATALTALVVGLERSLSERGTGAETVVGDLPPDRFPRVRSLDELTDLEPVWAFSLETLVEGLRSQLERRADEALAPAADGERRG